MSFFSASILVRHANARRDFCHAFGTKNLILCGFSVLVHIKECIIIVDSIFKNKIVDIQAFPAVIITTQKRDGFSQVIKK